MDNRPPSVLASDSNVGRLALASVHTEWPFVLPVFLNFSFDNIEGNRVYATISAYRGAKDFPNLFGVTTRDCPQLLATVLRSSIFGLVLNSAELCLVALIFFELFLLS